MRKQLLFLLLLLVIAWLPEPVYANYYWDMFWGERAYRRGEYQKAVQNFASALKAKPDNPVASYNLGSGLLKLKNYEPAREHLLKAAGSGDKMLQAKAEYNMGNLAFLSNQLPEALNHYIRAVELNPQDQDAKYNIQVMQQLLKKQKQSQQQEEQEQKEQQKGQQKKRQEAEQKGQLKKKAEEKKAQAKKEQAKNKEQKKAEPRKSGEMTQEEVERLLRYFSQKEKEDKAKRQQQQVKMAPKTEEDW